MPSILWKVAIFGFLLSQVFGCCYVRGNSDESVGQVTPNHVELEVGSSINITCRMNPNVFPNHSASDLYFINISTNQTVPISDVIVLNQTTIVYMLRNAPEQKNKYICKCGRHGIMEGKVNVGRRPQPVEIFNCRSFSFSYMECNFTKPENPVHTQYNLSIHYDDPNYKFYPHCDHAGSPLVICNISKPLYHPNEEIFNFVLRASNSLGQLTQKFEINNTKVMILASPYEFRTESISTDEVFLTFRMKDFESYRSKNLQWKVQLLPKNFDAIDLNNTLRPISGNKFRLRVLGLKYGYYPYRLTLRVRIHGAIAWSDTVHFDFQTSPRRPDRPPRVDVGSFYIDYLENKIRLFWEQLSPFEHNGENFTYIVDEIHRNDIVLSTYNLKTEPNSAVFPWQADARFEFRIRSQNAMGPSEEFSRIVIEAIIPESKRKRHTPPAVHNVYHETNETYTLTWEAPQVMDNLESYTVFWCRSKRASSYGCEGSMHFQHVPANVNKFTTAPQEHTLNLAVSANYKDFNTGLHWTECTMNEESDLIKMEPEVEAISSTALKVQWGTGKICPSIFERYNLSYCEVEMSKLDIDNDTARTNHCIEGSSRYVLVNKTLTRFEIHNLKPYTFYKVEMFMYSIRKVGKKSDPLIERTDEAAPSPPLQLKVTRLTNISATISWMPPHQPNGRIRTYIIVLNNVPCCFHKDENLYGHIEYELKNLSSYASYEVKVQAQTISKSLPSNAVHFTTPIGYPSAPGLVSLQNGSIIEWNKPERPSGRLEFYEVAVSLKRDENTIKRHISVIIGQTSCALRIPQCSDNEQYTVDIRAVNAALQHEVGENSEESTSVAMNDNDNFYEDSNELECVNSQGIKKSNELQLKHFQNTSEYRLYKSPWKQGLSVKCTPNSASVFIWLMSVLLVTFGFTTIAYLIRIKYTKMANIHCTLPSGLDAYMTKEFSNSKGKDEAIISRIGNLSQDDHTVIVSQQNGRDYMTHNEEYRLLNASSHDCLYSGENTPNCQSLKTTKSTLGPEDDIHANNECDSPYLANNMQNNIQTFEGGDKTNLITSNAESSSVPQQQDPNNAYIQSNELPNESLALTNTAIPMAILPANNCYITPNSLKQWENASAFQAPVPAPEPKSSGGYVSVESIAVQPKNILDKITSPYIKNMDTNGYVRPDSLETKFNFSPNIAETTRPQNNNDRLNKPLPNLNGYTTLEQLGKISNFSAPATNTNPGLNELAGASATQGISGYVTQKELTAFGQQQQSNANN